VQVYMCGGAGVDADASAGVDVWCMRGCRCKWRCTCVGAGVGADASSGVYV
jgi:hypothetical protein